MEFYSPPLTRARARLGSKNGKLFSLPVKMKVEGTKGKTRVFDEVTSTESDKDISSLTNEANVSPITSEVKKVKLSKNEMEMNGAPVGDIFDIKVQVDEDLAKLDDPKRQVECALEVINIASSTWAERYAAIEVLRRSILFCPNLMTTTVVGSVIVGVNKDMDSLRSCIIRNSVLCLRAVLGLSVLKEWIVSDEGPVFDELLGKLLLKSCNGPKFLCKIISEVLVISSYALPFARLCSILLSFCGHKNSEVCNQVYTVGCDNFVNRIDLIMQENDTKVIVDCLNLFQKGISSVKPSGRESSKKALKQYCDRAGPEIFNQQLQSNFTEAQCREIEQEMQRISHSTSRVPLKALKPSVANACMKCRVPFKSRSIKATGAKPWMKKVEHKDIAIIPSENSSLSPDKIAGRNATVFIL